MKFTILLAAATLITTSAASPAEIAARAKSDGIKRCIIQIQKKPKLFSFRRLKKFCIIPDTSANLKITATRQVDVSVAKNCQPTLKPGSKLADDEEMFHVGGSCTFPTDK
ncbi:hypothetical protein PspLS_09250 [Pyricularia sp. CBS 133598]|nr:hypothetical protein PspLS_09250 [Pyricularia sp. CBS 133598]